MPIARLADIDDLALLLDLLPHANPLMPKLSDEAAHHIWVETISRRGVFVFVSDAGPKIVASCMLITAPNLMRGGRGHGFIENVVTHAEFRRQGHGKAVMMAALQAAWAANCHHVLLQSGRKDPGVHRFYESCGLVPGIRVGYVAQRPDSPKLPQTTR